MKKFQTYILALVLGIPGVVLAGDIDELTTQCNDCHGPQGASSSSDIPIIGGQSGEYISNSLKSFQVWGRPCIKSSYRHGDTSRPKTDMCKVSAGLSTEDIQMLSDYYAGQPFNGASQEFDESLVAAGAALHEQSCANCHDQGGSMDGRAPRLAGQWVPYLRATLKYVPTGEHQVPPMMERGLGKFSEEEVDLLMNFYASQQDQD